MRLVLAATLVLSASPVLSRSHIDPGGVTLKVGRIVFNEDDAKVNYTAVNNTGASLSSVLITCTASLNGSDPIETKHDNIKIAPHETAYDYVSFVELHGETNVSASCRVESIDTD